MKTLLELLAQFCELSTISKAQLEQLEAAFAEVKPDYVTPEMTAAVDEIKAKFTEEAAPAPAADPAPTPVDPAPVDPTPADPAPTEPTEPASAPSEPEKAIEANEKGEVTLKFADYEAMKALATQTSKLVRDARAKAVAEKVD